jgi:GT2 family glycosyltransferase
VARPELSIVIPVYDNWWLTARCLRELERLRAGSVAFEAIVVDNASRDETPRSVLSFPWVRYLRNETNRNFAGACNAGARIAQAPLMLLLNNDAYPLDDALTPLVRAFDRREVSIAGGALFFEDGVTQSAGLVLLTNAHWHYFCRSLPSTLDAVDRPRDALGVSGAAMAVRTDWFVENGGFDESFVNGFEDVDLCLRALEQERVVAYVASARFIHYEAASAGRFDREAENERRFYRRWSQALAPLARTTRGDVGAVAVWPSQGEDPLLDAALADLEGALRSFGHPVVRGAIGPWRRVDRRFRRAASIAWFASETVEPSVTIGPSTEKRASIRTHGAVALEVPWLPCAAAQRVEDLRLRPSCDSACVVVGIAGGDDELRARVIQECPYPILPITPPMLFGGASADLACVVHLDRTDDAAFGNVLLAQAGLPAIVLATEELRALFAPDVAYIGDHAALSDAIAHLVHDPDERMRYGRLVAADSRRRFAPRRSAIRVVDLLCAARFGLERPAAARSNTPL